MKDRDITSRGALTPSARYSKHINKVEEEEEEEEEEDKFNVIKHDPRREVDSLVIIIEPSPRYKREGVIILQTSYFTD